MSRTIGAVAAGIAAGALAVLWSAPARAQDDDRNYRADEIRVGDNVTVDPSLLGNWQNCTVTAIKPVYSQPDKIDNVTVRCANGATYQPMASPRMVRLGGAGAGTSSMGTSGRGGGGYPRYAPPVAPSPRIAGGPAAAIPSGLYHCKAGNTRNMLTLGDMRIAGNRFTFTDPRGYRTSGTYSAGAGGYRWQGDIGRIRNSQITSSGPEPGLRAFWFMFREAPGSLEQSVSCGRIG